MGADDAVSSDMKPLGLGWNDRPDAIAASPGSIACRLIDGTWAAFQSPPGEDDLATAILRDGLEVCVELMSRPPRTGERGVWRWVGKPINTEQRAARIAALREVLQEDRQPYSIRWQLPRGESASFADAVGRPDGKAQAMPISCYGIWRVYFHRLNPEGLAWCVSPDDGSFEIAVRDVLIRARASTVHRPKATADDDDGRPSAWIRVEGLLTVGADGVATIEAA